MNSVIKTATKRSLCVLGCISFNMCAERVVVDEIRTVVYSEDGPHIILSSDIKPDLDGRPRSLYDVVCEEVMVCEADRLRVKITQEDVERYLGDLQKNNNMTRSAMERIMDEMGYTYAQGMEKLRRRQMGEQVIDYRVRSDARFVIPDAEIKKFDDAHPWYEQASYMLSDALVAEDGSDMLTKKFSQKELDALSWEEPFEVKEQDLADNMSHVADAKVGDIVLREPAETKGYVEMIRLVAKTPKRRIALTEIIEPQFKRTLGDKIAEVIRKGRFEELLKDYQKELLNKATMRFTYDKDRDLIMGGK